MRNITNAFYIMLNHIYIYILEIQMIFYVDLLVYQFSYTLTVIMIVCGQLHQTYLQNVWR